MLSILVTAPLERNTYELIIELYGTNLPNQDLFDMELM